MISYKIEIISSFGEYDVYKDDVYVTTFEAVGFASVLKVLKSIAQKDGGVVEIKL